MPWRRNLSIPVLVGLTGIADVTGKANPAVVANWRTRLEGFPPARVLDKHPKFDLVEVLEWYRDQGPRSSDHKPVTAWNVWPMLVSGFHSNASVADPRESLIALVLLQSLLHRTAEGTEIWNDLVAVALAEPAGEDGREALGHPDAADLGGAAQVLVHTARQVEAHESRAKGLLEAQLTFHGADVGYACDVIDALDQLHHVPRREVLWPILRLDPTRTRSLRATGRRLSGLMVAVAGVPPDGTVLDPACGEGELLIECSERLGGGVTLLGQEVDPVAWRIARSRLLVMGVEADLGAEVGDSLLRPQHRSVAADAVMVDPPLGDDAPALDRWIEFGFGQLRDGGRVVMALPLNEIVTVKSARRAPDRRVAVAIGELAHRGLIEGVLLTPPRLRGDVVGPMAVFSFRQSNHIPQHRSRVPVVTLLVEPRELHPDRATHLNPVLDDVARQFAGGFRAGAFRPPLFLDWVSSAALVEELAHRVKDVGSRDWTRSAHRQRSSADSAVVDSAGVDVDGAEPDGSVWRPISVPEHTEMLAAIEEPKLLSIEVSPARFSRAAVGFEPDFAPSPPRRTTSSSDALESLLQAQNEVLLRVRLAESRNAELGGAAERLLELLQAHQFEMPDDVWRRLEPTMRIVRRLVDER